jgi:hypothetical protein
MRCCSREFIAARRARTVADVCRTLRPVARAAHDTGAIAGYVRAKKRQVNAVAALANRADAAHATPALDAFIDGCAPRIAASAFRSGDLGENLLHLVLREGA